MYGNNSVMSRQGFVEAGIRIWPVWINPGQSVRALEPVLHPLVLCHISVRCHCPLSSVTILYILLRFHNSSDRSCFPNRENSWCLQRAMCHPLRVPAVSSLLSSP